ncbi:MAG: folate family ECF transporter S component [Eubacteriales bacterium]|nr:folate family ECF transporter S component [Eubacteriales bacterium]
MRKFLGLEKLTVRKLCMLGMLTALTVLLAIYCTFRIGNAIKIPFKFVTVFVTAVIFGPVWGGVVGALGDILNALIVPVGPIIPQITAVEFLYGFIFGLFFYKKKNYYMNTVICAVVLSLVDIFVVSYILTSVGYFPGYITAISIRLIASVVKLGMYILVCVILKKHLGTFERMINR